MAELTRLVYQQLLYLNDSFHKDPRVQHLPLVGSPFPVLAIVTVYVLFVKKWGPQWMENRKPLNVKLLIRLHNVVQIVLNGYALTLGFFNSYYNEDFSLTCRPVDMTDTSPSALGLLHATYIYYLTKYLDLFDTVFFVLRKKNSQISFLHVYHHAIMVVAVWLYITNFFGSHPTMLGILNSLVHVAMYTYYFLSSMDLKLDLLPWKKRITQIQILQFCYLTFHFSMPLINNWCNLSFNFMNAIAVIQNVFMASMFLEFYYKAYIKRDTNKTKLK
ncbi:elongation of very long chain fatty acids protein 7-like [Episyrphus balteatus]|uniref:elongation of very long chain fatty acids protein 7-like n=1 Tax=Episyrphus balteatus TaxID=286459 RepID=UPI00248602B0|nr:elongation of very long chain fatty acids protein 7-like [Episyrphus balteatus]